MPPRQAALRSLPPLIACLKYLNTFEAAPNAPRLWLPAAKTQLKEDEGGPALHRVCQGGLV